jgi:hypothetical protein
MALGFGCRTIHKDHLHTLEVRAADQQWQVMAGRAPPAAGEQHHAQAHAGKWLFAALAFSALFARK